MTLAAEKLKSELGALPLDDRAELARYLVQSLDEADEDVEDVWRDELDRRFVEIESSVAAGEPADQVIAEMRRKYA